MSSGLTRAILSDVLLGLMVQHGWNSNICMEQTPIDTLHSQSRLLGKIRRFDSYPSKALGGSFRVTWLQQIEADLIKTAMLRLDRIFRRRDMKARIVMMIHDALWVESPEEEAERVRHLVKRMMTTAANLDVPLDVDIK